MAYPKCQRCLKPMHTARRAEDRPVGTVQAAARGLCNTCYQREKRHSGGFSGDAATARPSLVGVPDDFHDQPWADRALCAQTDPDSFFPEKGGSTRDPKKVCLSCDVRVECLDWALATDQAFGIWGGHSERERRKLKKEQPKQLAATGTNGPTMTTTEDEQPALVQYGGTYVAGGTHRPIPLATDVGVRRAHQPKTPRVTGLDWSKHTAPTPEPAASPEQPVEWPCRWCRTPSAELVDDMCPDCRADAEKAFHAPDRTLSQEEPWLLPTVSTAPSTSAAPAPRSSASTTTAAAAAADDQANQTTKTTGPTPTTSATAPPATSAPSTTKTASTSASTAATAPDVVDHCAQLLRDTATSADPLVQMLRGSALSVLAALDHAHHPETPVAAASPGVAAPVERPVAGKAATGSPRPRAARRGPRTTVDVVKAKELLDQGQTCPEIARELGVGVKAVRTALDNAGIPRPDGRALRSGGKPKNPTVDDPQMVADVRHLYLDQGLTQAEVAAQLGTSTKTIQNLMLRHQIPARPPAHKIATARPSKLTDSRTIDELCARYQAGESGNALAKAYGVSLPTVLDRLRGRGVPIRSRGGHHPTTHPSGATA